MADSVDRGKMTLKEWMKSDEGIAPNSSRPDDPIGRIFKCIQVLAKSLEVKAGAKTTTKKGK